MRFDKEIIKVGRFYSADNEIVCSQDLLESAGITDFEGIIGKEITFTVDRYDKETSTIIKTNLIDTKKIVGVLDSKMSELDVNNGNSFPTVMMNTANIDSNNMMNSYFINVYVDSYFLINEVTAELKKILPDSANIAKVTGSEVMASLEGQRKIVIAILSVFCSLFFIITMITLIYECVGSYKKQQYHFSVLLTSGISLSKLWGINFVQLFLIHMLSAAIASVMSIPILFGINAILTAVTKMTIILNPLVFAWIICAEIIFSLVLCFGFSMLPMMLFKNKIYKNSEEN